MKARTFAAVLAFAGLSAWVSAQGPTGLSAHDRLKLLVSNKHLLEDLMDHGVRVADKNTPLDRAEECLKTADPLARELRSAVYLHDADRVAEMGDLLKRLVSDGFVPNLNEAKNIPEGSPEFVRLKEVHRTAARNIGDLAAAIPADGEWAGQKRVRDARERLTAAAGEIGQPLADGK